MIDRKVIMNQLAQQSEMSMIQGQNSFLNELVKSQMPNVEVDELLLKHNNDELALEAYVSRKI